MSDNMKQLHRKLKDLREDRGLSRNDLSRMLSISQSAYGNYELEKRTPDIKTLMKIANFYGCTLDYLVNRLENKEASDSIEAANEYKEALMWLIKYTLSIEQLARLATISKLIFPKEFDLYNSKDFETKELEWASSVIHIASAKNKNK